MVSNFTLNYLISLSLNASQSRHFIEMSATRYIQSLSRAFQSTSTLAKAPFLYSPATTNCRYLHVARPNREICALSLENGYLMKPWIHGKDSPDGDSEVNQSNQRRMRKIFLKIAHRPSQKPPSKREIPKIRNPNRPKTDGHRSAAS